MMNKLLGLYFFSIVIKLTIAYELSLNYESNTAEQKQIELWNILSSATGTSAEFPNLLSLSRFVCCSNIDYTVSRYADTMPHEDGKSLYSVGSVAKAVWTDVGGHPYTGLFRGQTRAIIRLSTLSQPDADGMTPALAIKLFRSGQPSANILAMQSTEGQTSGNFFQETLSNHAPYGIADSALAAKFSLVAEPASFTGLSDVSLFSQSGALASGIITFPYEVQFVPNQVLSSLFANRLPTQNLQEMFDMIPAGSKLYDVYAIADPGGSPQLIANLRTTSAIISSAAGDNFLFFRHQKMEDDVKLNPEWTNEVYGGSNVLTDIDFDNIELDQDTFNLTIPEDVQIPVVDIVAEDLNNAVGNSGNPTVGGIIGNLASNVSNFDVNNIPNVEGLGDIISQNIPGSPGETSETSTTVEESTTSSSNSGGSLGELITQNIPAVAGLIPGGEDSSTTTTAPEENTNTVTIPNVDVGNLGDLLSQNAPAVAGLISGNEDSSATSTSPEENTNTVTIPNVNVGNLGDLLTQNVPAVAGLIPGNEDTSATSTAPEENTNTINIPNINVANLGDIINENAPTVAGLIPSNGDGNGNEQDTSANGGNGSIGNIVTQNIPDLSNVPGISNAASLLPNNDQNEDSSNGNGIVAGVIANNLPGNQGNLPLGPTVALAGAVASNNENLSNANPGSFIGTVTETISENNGGRDEDQGIINGVLSTLSLGEDEDEKKEKEKEEAQKEKEREKEEKQKEKEEKEKEKQKEKEEKEKEKQKEKEEKEKEKEEKGKDKREEEDEWIEWEEEEEDKKEKNDKGKGKGRRVLCPGLRGMGYVQ